MQHASEKPDRILVGRDLVAAVLIVAIMAAVTFFFYGHGLPTWLEDKDFANYWLASRLVQSGQVGDLFGEHAAYHRHLVETFGAGYQWRNWSYPPHYLLFVWPLGLMGYHAAMFAFLVVTLALYLAAARAFVGRLDPRATIVLLGPFVIANLWSAQNGFLTGALLLGGLALRYERPVLAGILIGCLTIKPQLGILLPLFLLMERRWLVIASAGTTALMLLALSSLAFGIDSWTGYATVTLAYQSHIMNTYQGMFLDMMPSVFAAMRVLGFQAETALAAHGLIASACVAAAGVVTSRCCDPALRAAVLVLGTMVATPYWLVYDFGVAAAALLVLQRLLHTAAHGTRLMAMSLLVGVALVPVTATALAFLWYPVAPLLVVTALGYALVLALRHARSPLQKTSETPPISGT